MKNDGKLLEKTIRLVQETLKDSPFTEIHSNYRIPNESDNKREIDILIVSKINGFEIKIAVECKDYKSKIPAEKIEAFNSKCQRIKSINNMIFVSRKGYQKDAIESAKYFGIDLLTADLLDESEIIKWLGIKQIGLVLIPEVTHATISLNEIEENIDKLITNFKGIIYANGIDKPLNILEFIYQSAYDNKQTTYNLALLEWMRLDEKEKFNPFPIKFKIDFHDYYIKNDKDEKIKLLSVETGLKVKFREKKINVLDSRNVKKSNNEEIAKSISIDLGENLTTDIIISDKNDMKFFATDESGETKPLKKLFTYNPKEDKFE